MESGHAASERYTERSHYHLTLVLEKAQQQPKRYREAHMRFLPGLMIASSILAPTSAALACPPTAVLDRETQSRILAEEEKSYSDFVHNARFIVYGVVEKDISASSRWPGLFRITHVYKGDLGKKRTLRVHYNVFSSHPGCALQEWNAKQRKGTFGVAMIGMPNRYSRNYAFLGFIAKSRFEELVAEGVINSAQADRKR